MDSSFRLCDALWGARRRVPSCQGVRLSFSTTPTWWSANDLESDEGLRGAMTQHSHQTAPTQFVEANGIRFAYRRFGNADGVPIVFNQHYTGTMDYWDPAVTDGLAHDREVILFNNGGISSSSGEVPTTFEQMGANAIAFSCALGLNKADRAAGSRSRPQADPSGHWS